MESRSDFHCGISIGASRLGHLGGLKMLSPYILGDGFIMGLLLGSKCGTKSLLFDTYFLKKRS